MEGKGRRETKQGEERFRWYHEENKVGGEKVKQKKLTHNTQKKRKREIEGRRKGQGGLTKKHSLRGVHPDGFRNVLSTQGALLHLGRTHLTQAQVPAWLDHHIHPLRIANLGTAKQEHTRKERAQVGDRRNERETQKCTNTPCTSTSLLALAFLVPESGFFAAPRAPARQKHKKSKEFL